MEARFLRRSVVARIVSGRRLIAGGACALAVAACNPFPDLSALGGGSVVSGPDSGADGAPASGRFCATSKHTFCADFDGYEPLSALWTTVSPSVEVTTQSKSPPHAAHMTLPRSSSGQPTVTLHKDFDAPWGRVVLELDVFMAAPAWQGNDNNIFLAQVMLAPSLSYELWIDHENLLGITSNTPDYHPLRSTSGRLQYGAWTHVRLTAVPSAKGGTQDLAVGEPPVSVVKQDLDVTAKPGRGVTVIVGLERFNPPTPAFEVYFDNVTVDLGP